MFASKGILTSEGGATSHAAVVARQFGVPCIVGASEVKIDTKTRQLVAHGVTVKEGDWISLNGTTGQVFVGQIPTVTPRFEEEADLVTLLSWADDYRDLEVWTNADYPDDAKRARDFGAQGIGLTRTEHMFFEVERLPIVQKMILAKTEEERGTYLDQLLPFQQSDFEGIFEAMDGLPVTIRLIDPPLHEFLAGLEEQLEANANRTAEENVQLQSIRGMHESNPMMGLRGVRLSIVMPGIVKMQVGAIIAAACNVKLKGINPKPKIMIPLVGHVNELKVIQPQLISIAKTIMEEKGIEVYYQFGTMIEIPRAALTANEIAEVAEFFSFGTNDLTQFCFGYSRDDVEGSFIPQYIEDGILPVSPFQSLDQTGVGELMKIAIAKGKATRPDLEVGLCGEHGGDPASVAFCHEIGQDYVSCSPFRVPIARLAAAQAALKSKGFSAK
jgi:pyruvate,orthophosphate dikinase